MVHTKKLLRLNNSPVFIKHGSNNIDMIDNSYVHYNLDKLNYEVQKKTIIKKDTSLHEYTKVFDISNNSLGVYPKKDTKSITFIKNDNGLKIDSNLKLQEAASIARFSNNSKMLLIGSDVGSIWLYDVDIKKIIYTLNPRSDEISSIAFSKNDKLAAIGAYDKKIEIYDTTNWQLIYSLEVDSVVESIVISNNNSYLYSVLRDGSIAAFDIKTEEVIYNKSLGQHWLTAIITNISDNYCIVGTRDNAFLIIDLNNGKIIKNISLQNKGLNSADFDENSFCAVFADGSLLVCDMQKNKQEALVALKIEDYTKAKQLIDANILLYLDGTVEKLYAKGEKELKKIITLIELGEIEKAVNKAAPFMDNENFSNKFDSYMTQKKEIAQFISLTSQKDFASAYRLADEYQYIKELKKYQKLEEFWHNSFNEAKNEIAKNPNDSGAKIRAKGKLQSFLNVSSKSHSIKNLLENSILFFKADTLVKEKKFVQFFELCEEYQFLKDTKIYNKVMQIAQLLLSNVSKAAQQKDYNNAILTAKRLLSFTPVTDEAQKQIKEIETTKDFNKLIQEKNCKAIFKLVQENEFLENLSQYNLLINDFEKVNKDAKQPAMSGDISQTFDLFDEYMSIDYLKDRVAFTVKLAYLNSIVLASQQGEIEWKKTFLNYIELYGKDQELRNIAIENNVLNIYNSLHDSNDNKGYKKRAFKDNIAVMS